MEYKQLSEVDQKNALTDRQRQLEMEHLNTVTAIAEAQAKVDAGVLDSDDDGLTQLQANLGIIEAAHGEVTAQLDALPAEPSNDPGSVVVSKDTPTKSKKEK